MVDIETKFYCPNCNHTTNLYLGIIQFINYKGRRLALHDCPKCNKKVAFKINSTESSKLGNSDLNVEGMIMKEKVISIISNNKNILEKREDETIEFIIKELEKSFTEGYLRENEYEVKTIIEYILINSLYLDAYVYEDIKNDSVSDGCIYL